MTIHVGRHAVDREGIAELHGLTWHQAHRRRPWAQPGHPAPITRGRPALWDYEQARAYARGEAVPHLPTDVVHARDLLDRWEAAAEAGVDPVAWERDMYRDRVPPADEEIYGVPYWYRGTVWAHRDNRSTPKRGGGRPAGSTDTIPRAELRQRVAALLDHAIQDGEPISTAEIARRLGIHYTTARNHVLAIAEERQQP